MGLVFFVFAFPIAFVVQLLKRCRGSNDTDTHVTKESSHGIVDELEELE